MHNDCKHAQHFSGERCVVLDATLLKKSHSRPGKQASCSLCLLNSEMLLEVTEPCSGYRRLRLIVFIAIQRNVFVWRTACFRFSLQLTNGQASIMPPPKLGFLLCTQARNSKRSSLNLPTSKRSLPVDSSVAKQMREPLYQDVLIRYQSRDQARDHQREP